MFKVGDKVRCTDPYADVVAKGEIVTVVKISDGKYLKFRTDKDRYYYWRTERFEPLALEFAIGAVVRCTDAKGVALALGRDYVVRRITGHLLCVEGVTGGLSKKRFEVVKAAPDVPVPPPEKAAITAEQLRMALHEKAAKTSGNGAVTQFAVVRKGRVDPDFYMSPPCYASFNDPLIPRMQFAISSRGYQKQHEGQEEQAKPYINWLINESPYAPCFITKDVEDAWKHGLSLDCNKTPGQLIGAATVFREGTEYRQQLEMFNWALDQGYDGNVAYLLCCTVTKGVHHFIRKHMSSGHRALSENIGSDDLLSFFANGFSDKGKKPSNESTERYEVTAAVGAGDGYGRNLPKGLEFTTFIDANLPGTQTGTGWNASLKSTEEDIKKYAQSLQQAIKEHKK
jgi:hypothetical protein